MTIQLMIPGTIHMIYYAVIQIFKECSIIVRIFFLACNMK